MKIIEKTDDKLKFVSELDESLVNAIRRYVYNIPVLAVDEVEISKNDSSLYDETIAHRLGLIPLKSDSSASEKSQIFLKVCSEKDGMVYSGNMSGKLKPVYDKIPIVFLNKNQEVDISMGVRYGKGIEHSKFSPGIIFYRNVFDLKIDKDCPHDAVSSCPKKLLKLDGGKVAITDTYSCDSCEACVEFCQKKKKESINVSPSKEIFITIESFGQISPEEIFTESIDSFKKDLKEFSKGIEK